MSIKKLTRKQVKEGLTQIPIDQILHVPGELTQKQKDFAKGIALGMTATDSYRASYDTQGKPTTVGVDACKLRHNPKVALEIEAYKLAIEAEKHRTPAQLRALVIQSLVQVIIDPEASHSAKINASKVLGTVTEVSAFTERKEVTHITNSADARSKLMDELKAMMKSQAIDVDVKEVDLLLDELSGAASSTPHTPLGVQESLGELHTIPDTLPPSKSLPPESNQSTENTPLSKPF